MQKPKAYLFDVFGTIVDWRNGVATVARDFFDRKNLDENPHSFADAWRAKYQPAMEKIRSGNRGFVKLDTLHRENLDELLSDLHLEESFDEDDRNEFNKAWQKLPPWADCVDGLTRIKENAIIAPCSNGSIALMTRLAKFGALPWDCILGAEVAGNYKPHPDSYLKSAAALSLVPEQVMMVAAHNNDLHAARECGLQTAFIPRPTEHGSGQSIDLEPDSDWDYVIEKIGDLASL